MNPDHHVCLCFHVSLRKIRTFMDRERPVVASQLSECLSAGTGCQWCVPFLCKLHEQWKAGQLPDLPVSPEEYVARRAAYRSRRSAGATPDEAREPGEPSPGAPSSNDASSNDPSSSSAEPDSTA